MITNYLKKITEKLLLIVVLQCICVVNLYAQSSSQTDELTSKITQLQYSNPAEAIKIGKHLIKNTENPKNLAQINLLIAKSFKVMGNYNQAIYFTYNASKFNHKLDDQLKFNILILKSDLLRSLYIDSQSDKYLLEAEAVNKNLKNSISSLDIALSKAKMFLERGNYAASDQLLKSLESSFHNQSNNPPLFQEYLITKGKVLSNLNQTEQAISYFKKAMSSISIDQNLLNRSVINFELGKLYFLKKDTQKSIALLKIALADAEKINNITQQKNIIRSLITNYLALNNLASYQEYSKEFLKLNNQIELLEQEAVNTAFNSITNEQEQKLIHESQKYSTYFWLIFSGIIFVFIITFSLWLKVYLKKKRLTEILKYMEITRNVYLNEVVIKKEPIKKMSIPVETEQAILLKLKRFESSNKFIAKDMSLAVLAGQFDTNTKYLSEIINKHYQDNFNTYINKLRINFIIQKLKTDPNYMHYKISYLAERCGFSSHSSFATIFKSITGIAPVTFIELLKKETLEITQTVETIEV